MNTLLGLPDLPLPLRWGVVGAVLVGVVGAIVGLVVGLFAYAPTAWFAAMELGLPAAVVGGLIGLACGAVALVIDRG